MKPVSTPADALVLVPADRFFIQLVSLDGGAPAGEQVELALEAHSPFPLAQLYHGYFLSADRTRALAFACYRRRFSAEEQAAWPEAAAVMPGILALLGPPPTRPVIVLHAEPGRLLQGVAWDGRSDLPVALRAQTMPDDASAAEAALVAELKRAGAPAGAEVRRLDGTIDVRWNDRAEAAFRVGSQETLQFGTAALVAADVRDKSFLEAKRQRRQQDRRWWAAAVAVAALLAVSAVIELAAGGYALWNGSLQAALAQRSGEVRRIEAAQTMAVKIEQLAVRQQRPLEWLSEVRAVRPRSVQFTRMVGRSDRTLEIEAQTSSAGDVGTFEAALRKLPVLDRVEVRDLRAREGMTSFVVALAFKPAAAPAPAGEAKP
jgi:hypothetical protein